MPSDDITFCISKNCPKRDDCRRAHPPAYLKWASMSDFYVEGKECQQYWPIVLEVEK